MTEIQTWQFLTIIFMLMTFRLLWILPEVKESRRQAERWYSEGVKRFRARIRKRK